MNNVVLSVMREYQAEQKARAAASSPTGRIARNTLCPCGSGQKYKRCCGSTAAPVLGSVAAAMAC